MTVVGGRFNSQKASFNNMSYLLALQILREYGGIYLDNDCVVVMEFDTLRKHHCVVSKSSEERHMGNNESKAVYVFLHYG